MADSRHNSGLPSVLGHGMQSFLQSSVEFRDNKGSDIVGLGRINQPVNASLTDGVSFLDKGLFSTNYVGNSNILPTIPLQYNSRQVDKQQASHSSSLSEASSESESAQNTPANLNRHMGFEPPPGRPFQNWADRSPRGETSTSMEGEAKENDKMENRARGDLAIVSGSSDHDRGKITDSKVLRRLAQNREAARKSRLRKKAYVQQLESSRVKLNQMEQELDRVRQQGVFMGGSSGDHSHPGVFAFDMDHARWVEELNRQISELRSALGAHMTDNDLRMLVDNGVAHYDELFRLKGVAVKADVFHIVSGMWKTPAERCFMWMGGFRPSELLKILSPQLEPLTDQQVIAVCNLQQSSQQAEDALSQGMEALQQNLADTLSGGSLGNSNVANYMGQMAMAMGKLGTLENFVRQADHLRQQTLQQMNRILTTRQAARGLLAMGDYFSRLRALSSLWVARPRE